MSSGALADARDLYGIWLDQMWSLRFPSFGQPWEHLTDREQQAWQRVAESAPEGKLCVPNCAYCESRLECPQCSTPECFVCNARMICPDCSNRSLAISDPNFCMGESR
jgi:hypothetical protein